jgi:sulfate transport system substrate-binding protein
MMFVNNGGLVMRRRILAVVLGLGIVAIATAASALAGPLSSARTKDVTLNLVAYSTPRPVLTKLIEEYKKTPQGQGVTIRASYGPSSAQGQAVANGLPADGVILNTGNDINDLVDKGLISKNWDKQSYNGVVWNSVVVFGLRDGNPKKIKTWRDVTRSGVGVVTVNPFTGGIAKWNILASYVAQRKTGKTDKQAIAWLQEFYKNNVVAQESSGSNATNAYLAGRGDVLLTFESEAINGKIPYVIPKQTMLIDVYIAAIDKSPNKDEWNKFSQFLKTYPSQEILAENGYRPVNKQALQESRKRFPVRPGETKITNKLLGGWRAVDKKWFDPNKSIMQRIEESLGVPTG